MSALQCIPRETRDHFPLLCVLKSHYATTSLLAPLVFIVKYCCKKKPGNITVDYFPGCCATPAFWFLSLFFLSRITGVCFFQSFHISKALLYTNDSSRRAQNNIQSLCHVNTAYVSLHEIQPDVKRQLLHLASRGANAAMEIFRVGASLSPCLFLSGRCKWCKFLSCSTPVLFWCDGNPFARPITPSHQHYSFMLSALFSFLRGGGGGVEWTLQRCIVCLLISPGMQPGNIH